MTAAKNPDGSVVVVLFNPIAESKEIQLSVRAKSIKFSISGKAVQTLLIPGNASPLVPFRLEAKRK
jgi:glucosylceramidase